MTVSPPALQANFAELLQIVLAAVGGSDSAVTKSEMQCLLPLICPHVASGDDLHLAPGLAAGVAAGVLWPSGKAAEQLSAGEAAAWLR